MAAISGCQTFNKHPGVLLLYLFNFNVTNVSCYIAVLLPVSRLNTIYIYQSFCETGVCSSFVCSACLFWLSHHSNGKQMELEETRNIKLSFVLSC